MKTLDYAKIKRPHHLHPLIKMAAVGLFLVLAVKLSLDIYTYLVEEKSVKIPPALLWTVQKIHEFFMRHN
jgi:hypothetical protein